MSKRNDKKSIQITLDNGVRKVWYELREDSVDEQPQLFGHVNGRKIISLENQAHLLIYLLTTENGTHEKIQIYDGITEPSKSYLITRDDVCVAIKKYCQNPDKVCGVLIKDGILSDPSN